MIAGPLLLCMASVNAAEDHGMPPGWAVVSTNDRGVMYIHEDSIRRDGDFVEVWTAVVVDTDSGFKIFAPSPDDDVQILSFRQLDRLDCKQRRIKLLAMHQFPSMNLSGRSISVNIEDKWRHIAPDTVAEGMFNLVCE